MMPALNSTAGQAWLLHANLVQAAFIARANGQFFARKRQLDDDLASLTPEQFIAAHQDEA